MVEQERRAHARKRLSTAVTFNLPGGESLRGWLRDISRGGCFVATPSISSVGQSLDVVLRLPGVTKLLVGKARVVWAREKSVRDLPAGMGIEFVEMAEDSLAAIDALSATSPAMKKSRTFIGVAPPPPTSSPSFSPEVVPQEVVDALKAEAAAAREADLEKTERTQLPVEKIEEKALEVEAEPVEEAPPLPPPPPPEPPPFEPPAPTAPMDLPHREGPNRKKWLLAAGLGALGAGGIIILIVAFTHRGGGAADAAAEAAGDAVVEAAQSAVVADATLAATEPPDVGAPQIVDAHVEDATLDAHAHDAGRDAGHDAGHDAGTDAFVSVDANDVDTNG